MAFFALGPNSVATMVLVGAIGGFVRALVGILKYMEQNRRERKLRVGYFLFSVIVSAVIGGFAGAICEGNWKVAGFAGYAGTDFIESLYKIKKSQGLET
ncbi:MAG: hypothetical protein PHD74_10615 [Candidatus Krumholzibacteria bacterium]|nr:hypothetical protein [Candidatus Krumholzibacteria bacterium]